MALDQPCFSLSVFHILHNVLDSLGNACNSSHARWRHEPIEVVHINIQMHGKSEEVGHSILYSLVFLQSVVVVVVVVYTNAREEVSCSWTH